MFRSPIKFLEVPVGPNGQVIKNVTGTATLYCDVSFVATLGAVLYGRIPDEDTVTFETVMVRQNGNVMESLLTELPKIGKPNHFTICYFETKDSGSKRFDFADSCWHEFEWVFCGTHSGYKVMDKVTKFFWNSFNVRVFTNSRTKSVVVFMDRFDLQRLHYFQTAVLACMPWYFEPGSHVDDDVLRILQSFRLRDPAEYIASIKAIVDKIKAAESKGKDGE